MSSVYLHFPARRQLPQSASSWLFALSLIFVPLNDIAVAPHVSVGDTLFMGAVAAAFAERVASREIIPVLPGYLLGAALLFACYVANSAFNDDDQLSTFLVIMTMITLFPQAFVLLRIRSEYELRFMLYAWAMGGVIGAAFAVAYCNGFFQWHYDRIWWAAHRARGLTPHSVRLGLSCFMALPGLLLLLQSKHPGVRMLAVGLIGLVLKALDYSGSRSGLVAAFLVVSFWVVLRMRGALSDSEALRQKAILLFLGLVVFLAVLMAYSVATGEIPLVQGTLNRYFSGDSWSDGVRASYNQRAWKNFFDNPFFGHGYFDLGLFHAQNAHNIYLSYLSALGLVGFGVFIYCMWVPLLYPVSKYLRASEGVYAPVNHSLLAGAGALLVWLSAQPGFTNYDGMIVIGFLLYVSVWRSYDRLPTSPDP